MFPLAENKAHDLFFKKCVVVGYDAEQTIQDE